MFTFKWKRQEPSDVLVIYVASCVCVWLVSGYNNPVAGCNKIRKSSPNNTGLLWGWHLKTFLKRQQICRANVYGKWISGYYEMYACRNW